MIKPNNYENVSTGDFTPITPGGHHMIIKKVAETQSKSGKAMLTVYVDFAPNDPQPGYFSKLYEEDIRADKKWPRGGTIYVVSVDDNGQCSRNFKTFITCVERSNNMAVAWEDGPRFSQQFAGKKVGGVFGKVEDEYNGERKLRVQHRWFCDDAKALDAKVPEPKLLPVANAAGVPSGFTSVSAEDDPFSFS